MATITNNKSFYIKISHLSPEFVIKDNSRTVAKILKFMSALHRWLELTARQQKYSENLFSMNI